MSQGKFLLAKRTAQVIISELGIDQPDQIELELIAIDRGIFSHEETLSGADARLVTSENGKRAVVSVNSSIPEKGRKRFALAHEIGHFEMHRSKTKKWDCVESDFARIINAAQAEAEANVFAAELLMPENLFREACVGITPGFESIGSLAKTFDTSQSSTAYRYVEVGNYPCALICAKDGKIAWYSASSDFQYRLYPIGTELHKDTAPGAFFVHGEEPPSTAEPTLSDYWIEGDRPDRLFESSIAMSRYRTTLTLIWER